MIIPEQYEANYLTLGRNRREYAKRHYNGGFRAGWAQGKAAGWEEGLVEGRAELVLRQLSLLFGVLPEAVQARIRGASVEELDPIGERLLTAASLGSALDPR